VWWAWARAYSTDRGLTVTLPLVLPGRGFLLWREGFPWTGRFFGCGGDFVVGILTAAILAVK